MTWNVLGQPWMSWKPKKLHNFELQIGQVGTSWDELGTKEITEF